MNACDWGILGIWDYENSCRACAFINTDYTDADADCRVHLLGLFTRMNNVLHMQSHVVSFSSNWIPVL